MSKSPPKDLLIAIASEPITADTILKSGFDINAFGDGIDRTLLMAAAYAGRSDLIRELVHQGASINLGSEYEGAALHIAACHGHVDAVRTLLDLGADIEGETAQGITALMLGAAWGHQDVVEFLIAKGANPHHRDHQGYTALASAEEKEEHEIARLLEAAEQRGK